MDAVMEPETPEIGAEASEAMQVDHDAQTSAEGSVGGHPSGLFSARDYETTIRVLTALAPHQKGVYTEPSCRSLRKAMLPFIEHLTSQFPKGPRRTRIGRDGENKMRRLERKKADAAADQKLLDSRALRSARIAQLESLVTGVPDGVAEHNRLAGVMPESLVAAQTPNMLEGTVGEPAGAAAAVPTADTIQATGGSRPEGVTEFAEEELLRARHCYICKARFRKLHHFYDKLCPDCAVLNYAKRTQVVDLVGRIVLLTGGRVKIGYRAALKLLRCGATVIVTTRFPADAARRYSSESDYANWSERLHVKGLDMKCIAAVEAFTGWVAANFDHLDAIINNACQTIRRPPQYYAHLLENERKAAEASLTGSQPCATLDSSRDVSGDSVATGGVAAAGLQPTAIVSVPVVHDPITKLPSYEVCQVPVLPEDKAQDLESFPPDALDVNGQQIDLRKTTSWLLKLDEVQTPELCEVMAVNSVAPFILNGKLRPLLKKSPHPAKFIVNVSAMEGKFYRYKTPAHPHTNMAKAALNMMTKTSASDYHTDGIFMTAVDTGWINDENPLEKAQRVAEEHNFQTPLDEIDAAARIVDPVLSGISDGDGPFGVFLKDYVKTEW